MEESLIQAIGSLLTNNTGATDLMNRVASGQKLDLQSILKSNEFKSLFTKDGLKNIGSKVIGKEGLNSGLYDLGFSVAGTGLEALGVKKAERTNMADKGIDIASKYLQFIPGVGTAASVALKGLNFANNYLGKSTNKEGTIGMDTGGYDLKTSGFGGIKGSGTERLWDWMSGGKTKLSRHNAIIAQDTSHNLQAGSSNYDNQRNNLMSTNTYQDIQSRNIQSLYGGIDNRLIAAKKGAKIPPAQLRDLVKKAQRGIKLKEQPLSFEDWYKTVPEDRNDTTNYRLRRAYELADKKDLEKWRTATPEQLKDEEYHLKTFYWNKDGIGEFVKSKNHSTVNKELDWYNSDDAKEFRKKYYLFDDGTDYYQYRPIERFKNGGEIKNVIPEGALHARKHNLPEEISEHVTRKGIPVITLEDGDKIVQHAEVEVNEIIFHKKTTDKLEDFFKRFNEAETKKEKDKIAIEAGRFLTTEILENTDDNTGLLQEIE